MSKPSEQPDNILVEVSSGNGRKVGFLVTAGEIEDGILWEKAPWSGTLGDRLRKAIKEVGGGE